MEAVPLKELTADCEKSAVQGDCFGVASGQAWFGLFVSTGERIQGTEMDTDEQRSKINFKGIQTLED